MTDEEKAEEYANKNVPVDTFGFRSLDDVRYDVQQAYLSGIKIGREDAKHDLMMKLKDEGIVKPLKDSIISNKKLSSQEQQELCAWIECAMGFGEMLEEAKSVNEWHMLDWEKDYPKRNRLVRVRTNSGAEYICETYDQTTEDEIGYSNIITQFEELNGDWVDDTEIEYWCYIEPFKG